MNPTVNFSKCSNIKLNINFAITKPPQHIQKIATFNNHGDAGELSWD